MTDNQLWFQTYNNIFKMFPPSDDMIEKIVVYLMSGTKEFKTTTELLLYLAENSVDDIDDDQIEFYINEKILNSKYDKMLESIL